MIKILICGKGGSGKSTVASLLAKNLQTKGYRIIVVDADESNYGLSAQLGLKAPKELMDHIGGKKAVFDKMWASRSVGEKAPLFTETWRIDDIPADCVSKKTTYISCRLEKSSISGKAALAPWVDSRVTS